MFTSPGAFARPYEWCLRRFLLAIAMVAFIAFVAPPSARADVVYTFLDLPATTVLQFDSLYIVAKDTAPVRVTNFIVAPRGFLPCTLAICTSAANTLGSIRRNGRVELWAITGGPFPMRSGPFSVRFVDILWGFAGDIPGDGGRISPEPASLLLFGTGIGAIGIWKLRRNRGKGIKS